MTLGRNIAQGFRSALRFIRRQPGLAAALILTAATGLAANTALFTIVDGLFFQGLPYRSSEQLVHLELRPTTFLQLALKDRSRLLGIQQSLLQSDLLAGLTFFREDEEVAFAADMSEDWRSMRVTAVSPEFFDVLGMGTEVGRTFGNHDDIGRPRPMLVSHELWTRAFGGDREAIGRVVDIPGTKNRGACVLIGVMPKGFAFPQGTDAWIVERRPQVPIGVGLVGRLSKQGSLVALRAALPEMTVISLREHILPADAVMVAYLLIGSLCLFLVAWLQVGTLFVSRMVAQAQDFGLKLALGATPSDLRIQCFAEIMSIVVAAVALACCLSPILNTMALHQLPDSLTADQAVTFGVRGIAFVCLLGVSSGALLSVIPVSVIRSRANESVSERLVVGAGGPLVSMFRRAVFVVQLAAVTALIYLATVVLVSYDRVSRTALGFDADSVWGVALPPVEYQDRVEIGQVRSLLADYRNRVGDTIAALATLPEVRSVATSSYWPMQGRGIVPALVRAESDPAGAQLEAETVSISVGFVKTLGIELIEGREMSESEAAGVSESALVPGNVFGLANTSLARHLAQFGKPVGQIVVVAPNRRVKIVGVIADVRLTKPDQNPHPAVFAFFKTAASSHRLLIRGQGGGSTLSPMVRDVVARMWGPSAFGQPFELRKAVEAASADYRARAIVLSLIGIVCLPLAGLGLVGAAGHAYAVRRHELAVRLALGSTANELRKLLLRQFIGLSLIGLTTGLGTGVAAGQAMSAFLFGISSGEPMTVLNVGALMTALVGLAIVAPLNHAISGDIASDLRGRAPS